jgi:hypothetical protein
MDTSRYSKPTHRPGFLVELMCPLLFVLGWVRV